MPTKQENIIIFNIHSIKISSKFASKVNPFCFKLDVNNGDVCCDLRVLHEGLPVVLGGG